MWSFFQYLQILTLEQLCRPNEPGVFIGKIIPNNPSRAFLGYVDEKASSKKVVRDVFKKGDSAFLSVRIRKAIDHKIENVDEKLFQFTG